MKKKDEPNAHRGDSEAEREKGRESRQGVKNTMVWVLLIASVLFLAFGLLQILGKKEGIVRKSFLDRFHDFMEECLERQLPAGSIVYGKKIFIPPHRVEEFLGKFIPYWKLLKLKPEEVIIGNRRYAVFPIEMIWPQDRPFRPMIDLKPLKGKRGIYLRGDQVSPVAIQKHLRWLEDSAINSIVFDIKDVGGAVHFPTGIPLKKRERVEIPNLSQLVSGLRKNKYYSIARIAVFQDFSLAKKRKDWAIRYRDGRLLRVKGRPAWIDPGHPEVRAFLWTLFWEVAESGVDEIQLDYIRYPAEGNLKGIRYRGVSHPRDKTKYLLLFIRGAYMMARLYGIGLSADVFGIVAWGYRKDIEQTGQDLKVLSYYLPVISPMLYPSHFNRNFDGFSNPADQGYHFLYKGTQLVSEMTERRSLVRPWLQAFSWRVQSYSPHYLKEQIEGAIKGGASGFLFWNAKNRYRFVSKALLLHQRSRKGEMAL